MQKTYRPKKSLLWLHVRLAFFLIAGAASVGFFLRDPELQGAEERIGAAIAVGLFWAFMASLAVWEIVAESEAARKRLAGRSEAEPKDRPNR